MDNNHDLEQAQQLDHQMRSIRSQWIRLVLARTVLLMMVPFGGLLVMSIYFYLIGLSNVIMAFAVTYVICSVLIAYALFSPVNRDTLDPYVVVLVLNETFQLFPSHAYVFMYGFLTVIYQMYPDAKFIENILNTTATQVSMILFVLINIFVTSMNLARTSAFGRRAHQLLTVRNAAYHLFSQITLLYMSILAIVVIDKAQNVPNPFDWILSF